MSKSDDYIDLEKELGLKKGGCLKKIGCGLLVVILVAVVIILI